MNIEDIQSVLGLIKIYLSTTPSALCPSTQCHRSGSFGKEIDLFFLWSRKRLVDDPFSWIDATFVNREKPARWMSPFSPIHFLFVWSIDSSICIRTLPSLPPIIRSLPMISISTIIWLLWTKIVHRNSVNIPFESSSCISTMSTIGASSRTIRMGISIRSNWNRMSLWSRSSPCWCVKKRSFRRQPVGYTDRCTPRWQSV